MKESTKKYWWIFIGFVLFGLGIISKIDASVGEGYGTTGSIVIHSIFLLGAAFIAWGLSNYK